MTDNLSSNLEKLKSTFNNILLLRNDVNKTKQTVNSKIVQLKTLFGDLSRSTTKKALLFSLDSFFFQYKLFSVELESIDKFRILLNNRMYCDYYKLSILINNYIKEHADELLKESLEFRAFPVYKDLEPFQEYNLDDIINIHSDIMKHINYLYRCYEVNREIILNYNKNTRIGFSISNLLNTLEHDNTKLKQQMMLYINYLSFFHISQTKHLKKLLNQLKEFDEEIEENIGGNHIYSVDDIEYTDSFRKYEDEPKYADIMNENQPTTIKTKEEYDNSESSSINITLTPDTSTQDTSTQDTSTPDTSTPDTSIGENSAAI